MSTNMYLSDYMMDTTIATPKLVSHTYSLGLTDDHEWLLWRHRHIYDVLLPYKSLKLRSMLWLYDEPSRPNESVTSRITWNSIQHMELHFFQDSHQFRRTHWGVRWTWEGPPDPHRVRRTFMQHPVSPYDKMDTMHPWDHRGAWPPQYQP